MWEAPPLSSLRSTLADHRAPVGMRMRATYFLRQEYENCAKDGEGDAAAGGGRSLEVIDVLSKGLGDVRHGALLRHEFAYVLGQLRDERAIAALERTLLDDADDIMVRHECAEALGAIGSPRSVAALSHCAGRDASIEVGETCRLALDFIKWKARGEGEGEEAPMACACMLSPYSSVDPAPPHPKHAALSSREIGAILTDEAAPMFERYRAMFSLRNRGGAEAVSELGNALVTDNSSALLRHEVAYVLGQMQHSDAVEYLATSLKRHHEHRLVRHESAEALGAIEERWGECEAILDQFLDDEDEVVRQSCMVALDAVDYWAGGQGPDEGDAAERINFSLHKAETNGKQPGVLHNHFNVVE